MTWKPPWSTWPFGARKGGIILDPKRMSSELERHDPALCERNSSADRAGSGYSRPDVYTDSQTMAWIMDTYSMMKATPFREWSPASRFRWRLARTLGSPPLAGLMYVVEEACKLKKIPLRGASVAVQGFGNRGCHGARLLLRKKQNCGAQRYSRRRHQSPRHRSDKSAALQERSGNRGGHARRFAHLQRRIYSP